MNNMKQDIKEQFNSLRNDIKNQLDKDFNIEETKIYLSEYLPKEVIYNSEILLETLLSYLMKDAKTAIESFDVKTKNKFYDKKLNEKIFDFANNLKKDKDFINKAIEFQKDPRKLNAVIASGTTLIIGSLGIISISSMSIVGLIIAGIVVIAVSAFAFKLTYDKTTPKTRNLIRDDVDNYLKETEKKLEDWLEEISNAFNNELQNFIDENSNLQQTSN